MLFLYINLNIYFYGLADFGGGLFQPAIFLFFVWWAHGVYSTLCVIMYCISFIYSKEYLRIYFYINI